MLDSTLWLVQLCWSLSVSSSSRPRQYFPARDVRWEITDIIPLNLWHWRTFSLLHFLWSIQAHLEWWKALWFLQTVYAGVEEVSFQCLLHDYHSMCLSNEMFSVLLVDCLELVDWEMIQILGIFKIWSILWNQVRCPTPTDDCIFLVYNSSIFDFLKDNLCDYHKEYMRLPRTFSYRFLLF